MKFTAALVVTSKDELSSIPRHKEVNDFTARKSLNWIDVLLASARSTIFPNMIANVLKVPLVPDYIGYVEAHFLREFAGGVEDWSRCINMLTLWEDEHLLDNPTSEDLAAHKQTIERLLRFGRVVALATGHPDFPDRKVADIVAATQSCLNDKLAMWHGPKQSEERRREILKTCLNES